jgi:transposase
MVSAAASPERYIPATAAGFADLLTFCRDHVSADGQLIAFGVGGTDSYAGRAGPVPASPPPNLQEVSRPPRRGQRRLSGKSDSINAEYAAPQVLAGTATAGPKAADGQIEALWLIKIARDSAVKAQAAAIITLKATLVTASDQLRPLTDHKLVLACADLPRSPSPVDPDQAMRYVLGSLARRWLDLHEEIKSSRYLKTQTKQAALQLVQAVGIGFDIAALMLTTAGDNQSRIRSEAGFAKGCGACPIPAGTGKPYGRNRLNRGGHRQANAALFRAVIVRMRWHQPPSTTSLDAPKKERPNVKSSAC